MLDGMIGILNSKCIFENYEKYPSFNYLTEEKPIYCKTHM